MIRTPAAACFLFATVLIACGDGTDAGSSDTSRHDAVSGDDGGRALNTVDSGQGPSPTDVGIKDGTSVDEPGGAPSQPTDVDGDGDPPIDAGGGDCDDDDASVGLSCSEWSQVGHDAGRSGFDPDEVVLDPANVADLAESWRYGLGSDTVTAPVVAQGLVFTGSAVNGLYAVDVDSGLLAWWTPMSGVADGGIAVSDGIAFAPSSHSAALYAYDADTGDRLWKAPLGGKSESAPAVLDGIVYHACQDGLIYALDAATGARIWALDVFSPTGSPAVAGHYLYAVDDEGSLLAVDRSKAVVAWSFDLGQGGGVPAVVDGVVYAGTASGTLVALDADSGEVLFSAATGGAAVFTPSVADGRVFVSADDDRFYAFDADDGALLWSAEVGASAGAKPAVANGVVYSDDARDGQRVVALDAGTGSVLWSQDLSEDDGGASPVISDGMLFVMNMAGRSVDAWTLR